MTQSFPLKKNQEDAALSLPSMTRERRGTLTTSSYPLSIKGVPLDWDIKAAPKEVLPILTKGKGPFGQLACRDRLTFREMIFPPLS